MVKDAEQKDTEQKDASLIKLVSVNLDEPEKEELAVKFLTSI